MAPRVWRCSRTRPSKDKGAVLRRGTHGMLPSCSTASGSLSGMPHVSAIVSGARMLFSGSDTSARAERPMPHAPAYAHFPTMSSRTSGMDAEVACACTKASAASSAQSGSPARRAHCGPTAIVIAAPAPPLASSASSFHRVCDGTRSSSKGKAASPSTSAAGRPCAGAGMAASTRHSVAYRWRCAGASDRSARDLKPSSCALDCPSTPPRRTETAAAPCRATACEHKHARMVSAGAGRKNRGHFL